MTFRIALSGAQQAKLLLVGALATGVLSTVAGRGTMAYFTTQVTSTPNTFTAGTLRLEIADVNDARSINPVTSSIVFNNIKPGDTVYAPIELTNTGTLDLKYGLRYTTATSAGGDQDLAPALKLAINSSVGGTGTKATVAASAGVSDDEQGLSSALINAARQVGAALGVAILLSVAAASTQGRTGSTAALADGYRTAMAVAAGLALVAAVISARLVHKRTHRRRFGFSASRRTSVNGSSSREVGEHTVLSS